MTKTQGESDNDGDDGFILVSFEFILLFTYKIVIKKISKMTIKFKMLLLQKLITRFF